MEFCRTLKGVPSPDSTPCFPIKDLTIYNKRWSVIGRVTSKGMAQKFNNTRGDGEFFSIDIIDAEGTRIRCTFFGKAVEKFMESCQCNHVYTFKRGTLKKRIFNYGPADTPYEISFDEFAVIKEVKDDGIIPNVETAFLTLAEAITLPNFSRVNIHVIVVAIGKLEDVDQKFGETRQRCRLEVLDQSEQLVELFLWGPNCKTFLKTIPGMTAVVFQKVKFTMFNSPTLCFCHDSYFCKQSDQDLENWFRKSGNSLFEKGLCKGMPNFRDFHTLQDVLNDAENLSSRQSRTYDTIAHVPYVSIRDRTHYQGCAGLVRDSLSQGVRPCNGRVSRTVGGYFCRSCGKNCVNATPRVMLQMLLRDRTTTLLVRVYQEEADIILGMPAAELTEDLGEEKIRVLEGAIEAALYKVYSCKLQARLEDKTIGDPPKFSIVAVAEVEYSRVISANIDKIRRQFLT